MSAILFSCRFTLSFALLIRSMHASMHACYFFIYFFISFFEFLRIVKHGRHSNHIGVSIVDGLKLAGVEPIFLIKLGLQGIT